MLVGIIQTGFAQQTVDNTQIADKVMPAVVTIKGSTENGEITGSGFLIDSKGIIATCLHVVRPLKTAKVVLANGDIYDSIKIRAFDERRDLAIIQIAGFDLPSIQLGNSNNIKQAEPVLLLGAPNTLQGSITGGLVSAIRDTPEGFKVIQTDAASNPGNSGGPLVNSRAEVIGVLGFKLRGSEGQNFAIPINYIRGMAESTLLDLDLDTLREKSKGVGAGAENEAHTANPIGRAANIRDAKTVFVGSFGPSEAAFLVREKLINRLTQKGIQVVMEAQDADAVLAGFVGADSEGRAGASVFRLYGEKGKVLWTGERGPDGWGGSASSNIANKIGDALSKAIKGY